MNHQIYHEGRRHFYGHNTFIFESKYDIPLFVISIGLKNAVLLRDVQVRQDDYEVSRIASKNYMDIIKSSIIPTRIDTGGCSQASQLDIQNDEILYMDFARRIGCSGIWLQRQASVGNMSLDDRLIRQVFEVVYKRGVENLRGGVVFETFERLFGRRSSQI